MANLYGSEQFYPFDGVCEHYSITPQQLLTQCKRHDITPAYKYNVLGFYEGSLHFLIFQNPRNLFSKVQTSTPTSNKGWDDL